MLIWRTLAHNTIRNTPSFKPRQSNNYRPERRPYRPHSTSNKLRSLRRASAGRGVGEKIYGAGSATYDTLIETFILPTRTREGIATSFLRKIAARRSFIRRFDRKNYSYDRRLPFRTLVFAFVSSFPHSAADTIYE